MNGQRYLVLMIAVAFHLSCTAQRKGKPYYEDLTANRPTFPLQPDSVRKKPDTPRVVTAVHPVKNVNTKVDAVLDSIDRINLTRKFVDGFTIQIYSGQRREDAMNTKQKMVTEVSDLTSTLQYIQPKFTVTVGSYLTRIDAQKDLVRLKKYFANAILVPEKILIR
jgi:septal ring-binding cell division protein DamX